MKKEMDMLEDKEKLKTNNKKKKIIVTTVTTAVVFITVGTGVYINHLIKVKNYLSDLTYDIVQESYDTYGDYSKSKYQDIVPENIYSIMNLLPGPGVGDGSNYHIAECYHTNPITLVLPGNTAKSFYKEKCFYIIKNEDHRSGGATSPTVYWKLDDDNVWRVSDFDSPP